MQIQDNEENAVYHKQRQANYNKYKQIQEHISKSPVQPNTSKYIKIQTNAANYKQTYKKYKQGQTHTRK